MAEPIQLQSEEQLPPPGPTPIQWPGNGDMIRIWSLVSHQNDGFWQVTNTGSDFDVNGKGEYGEHNTKFRFYGNLNSAKRIESGDETLAWIGINGDDIGGKSDKIYMLQWYTDNNDKTTIKTKPYPLPSNPREPPNVPDSEQDSLDFYVEFGSGNYFIFSHPVDSVKRYARTGGGGGIKGVKETTADVTQSAFSDPGTLHIMSKLTE